MIIESFSVGFGSLLFAFLGFAIGRYGDKYGGHLNLPHHWIWGVLISIAGICYYDSIEGIFLITFGIGLFISDLNDFLCLRFWGPDEPHEWEFWSTL